jgi:hypothetical protein
MARSHMPKPSLAGLLIRHRPVISPLSPRYLLDGSAGLGDKRPMNSDKSGASSRAICICGIIIS